MLRFRPIKDAKAAGAYYGKSDGGYYLDSSELWREVGGEGAKQLGLKEKPDFEQFKRLLQGLDPHTGDQLTSRLVKGRLAGWDVTASVPKGVTIAIQAGDTRVHEALWEAGREAMADLERLVTTRVRKGGQQDNRVTGNLIWYGFEHPETRPAKEDGMPDPDRHIHFVIPNATFDPTEGEWKAIKFRPLMDMRKYFSHRFDLRLSSKLADLGYEVETKYRPDPRGGKRYYSWDIKGMPQSVVKKFSRRAGEVEELADHLGIENPVSKDKLGATSRMHKRKDMTFEDYRRYWNSRITGEEGKRIVETIQAAIEGKNPKPQNTADKGMAYAIGHEFYQNSVVEWTDLAITAMERCMGGAKPEEIEPEARRQGVLLKDGQATTRHVLEQEERIVAFAREGRGRFRPMGGGEIRLPANAKIKPTKDQPAMVRHVQTSTDQVILVRGGAGTGKTEADKWLMQGINLPYEVMAPSSTASRDVLRKDFKDADTVASFLLDRKRQERIHGGVMLVDEAGQLSIDDLEKLCLVAKEQNARLILQGDPKQHKSVARHGNMFKVLREFAGLPLAELKEIVRQQGEYKEAVAAIQDDDHAKAIEGLAALGWVESVEGSDITRRAAEECWDAMSKGQSFVVIGITHKQNDEITDELRRRLKEAGRIDGEETSVRALRPLAWSDAEKADLENRYDGTEVIQFIQNSPGAGKKDKGFIRGEKASPDELLASGRPCDPKRFAVYDPVSLNLAAGDTIRITAGGKTKEGRRLDNGQKYTFMGLTEDGHLRVSSGKSEWTIDKDFGHIAHGLVDTSFKAQGQTKQRVIAVMSEQALPAIRSEQFYVDLSRAKVKATVITDLDKPELLKAVKRSDSRKSAIELMRPRPKPKYRDKARKLIKRIRDTYRQFSEQAAGIVQQTIIHKEYQHAR